MFLRVTIDCSASAQPFPQRRHEDQRRQFACALTDLLKPGINFLGEEIDHKQTSIAQVLAQAFGCNYSLIDMPLAERTRRGCCPDYEVLHKINGAPEDILNCHRLRELYMCERTVEHLEPGGHGLVLCGRTHAERLRDDLANRDLQAELGSLKDYGWFDRDLYGWQ